MTQLESSWKPYTALAGLPSRVRIVEVSPRDGLQNEAVIVAPEKRAELVRLLAEAGARDIEVGAFVREDRVPSMAGSAEVFRQLGDIQGRRLIALTPNQRGLDDALACGVKSIALFTAASETFCKTNIGMSIDESIAVYRGMVPEARANGLWVRAYVSTAFVCPYAGAVTPAQVLEVVRRVVQVGVDEVCIADTVGRATPGMIAAVLGAIAPVLPIERTACHFHDTFGCALANVLVAMQRGVTVFDSAAGGVGGCPFAPGAAGNLATEDLVWMLHGMGIETGYSLDGLVRASTYLSGLLGRPLQSKALNAIVAMTSS